MMLTPRGLKTVTSHLTRKLAHRPIADLRPMPVERISAIGGRPLFRYRGPRGVIGAGPPVLFVPPLAVPSRCYDLRRGCSLAEHAVTAGRRSYLLEHPAQDRDPDLGEWIDDLVPAAVRAVSADAGGRPVQLVGWCVGGTLALLAAADDPSLPIASIAVIGSRVVAGPARPAAPAAGGAPLDFLRRHYRTLTALGNADLLAQDEAVEHYRVSAPDHFDTGVRNLYSMLLGDRINLSRVGVPVLAVAGREDTIAPLDSMLPITGMLGGSSEVRFRVAPGGHLGVLTGRAARATTWAHLDRWLDEGIVRHGLRPRGARRAAASR